MPQLVPLQPELQASTPTPSDRAIFPQSLTPSRFVHLSAQDLMFVPSHVDSAPALLTLFLSSPPCVLVASFKSDDISEMCPGTSTGKEKLMG